MSVESTSKTLTEMERFWVKSCLPFLTPAERLEGLDEKEILSAVNHQKLLVTEIEAYLKQIRKQSQ